MEVEAGVVCVGGGAAGELILLLQNVNLQVDKEDKWLWALESSHVFTVRSAYKLLSFQPPLDSLVAAASL